MNKKKVIVLSVIGLVIFCMLAGMTACTAIFVKEVDRELERQEQLVEQPKIEDEYLNQDDLHMIELPGQPESGVQQGEAYNAVAPYVDEAFGPTGLEYTLEESFSDGITLVTLRIDMTHEEIKAAMISGEWDQISELGLLASQSMYQVLQSKGIDAHFGIAIGDIALDECYYAAVDGQLVMDIPNGVQ